MKVLSFISFFFLSFKLFSYSEDKPQSHVLALIKKIYPTNSLIKNKLGKSYDLKEDPDVLNEDKLNGKRLFVALGFYTQIKYRKFYYVRNYEDYLQLMKDKIRKSGLVSITIYHRKNFDGTFVMNPHYGLSCLPENKEYSRRKKTVRKPGNKSNNKVKELQRIRSMKENIHITKKELAPQKASRHLRRLFRQTIPGFFKIKAKTHQKK